MGLAVCLLIFAVILFIAGMMFSQWQAEKLRQRNAGLAHDGSVLDSAVCKAH